MRFLIFFALIAASALAVRSQETCSMSNAQLQPVRKLRLGMDRAEFEKHYSGANILVMKRHAADKRDFDGLDGIAFDFHEGRLYFIAFDYDGAAVKWTNVHDFARKVSEDLKLPFGSWRFEPGDFLATMTCADFFVKLNSKDPTLTLRDTVIDKAKKASERKAAEDKKTTLKP